MSANKIILFFFFFASLVFPQSPQGINYQAVVRDADGILYENQTITVIFKLIVIETGNISWEESHQVQTNDFGLFTTIIGQGETNSNTSFSDLNWAEGTIFITVDIDFDNEGPQPPVDFGETQLLSVPYAFFSNSSGDNKWIEENNVISPINQESKIHINSSSEINLNSENIDIGSGNSTLKFNYDEVKFFNNENLFMYIDSDILDVQGRINSYEPVDPSNVSTKNYVDNQDDGIVLQMNSAFTENINYFQSEIDDILINVSSLEENVNANSDAFYSLQDLVNSNNNNLQDQVDLISSIISALEESIYENISLQNQITNMQNEISNLNLLIEQIQESISQE